MTKPTVEEHHCAILTISHLRKNGLKARQLTTMSYELPSASFWADIAVDLRSEADPHVTIRYVPRIESHGSAAIGYRVDLVASAGRTGGQRWWFKCPKTGARVLNLYLPEGEQMFLSRAAYGLSYTSQRVSALERLRRKQIQCHRSLGGDGSCREVPERPKGMHVTTYRQRVVRYEQARKAVAAAKIPTKSRRSQPR